MIAALHKSLGDRDPSVRRASAEALVRVADGAGTAEKSVVALRKLLKSSRDPWDRRVAIDAISALDSSAEWREELAEWAVDEAREVRNAALVNLARSQDGEHRDLVLGALAHDDPSTRLVVADTLAEWGTREAVPALIERLAVERGRQHQAVADALWQLTAQPLGDEPRAWQEWWRDAEPDFEVATDEDLAAAEEEREARRLSQRTVAGAKFFGIQIESHRVIFILDVSGSMIEAVLGREIDGRGAARIDVAKEELKRSIEQLDANALFNVYAFSSSVAPWQKRGLGVGDKPNREAALTWVDRLGARGGTNIYDTLEMAFDDPDVDTIYLLSDGEPTTGKVIDLHTIRTDVRFWNEHRHVRIHTVAFGEDLELLEWLATDSGGRHVRIR